MSERLGLNDKVWNHSQQVVLSVVQSTRSEGQSRDATPMSRSQSVSVVIPTTLPPEFSNPVIRSPEPHTPTTTATTLTKPQATASPTASSTPRLHKMVNPIKRQYRKHNVAYWSKFKTWLK
ncbi:hypothetical protein PGTUg99_031061 [Puccinia graminis f. sp. tritici]|uniref:Uncharacterized protein n=1 Tax=Puccinia graminis f. sp. tritici TaxID=56615 RepID=A0A5B0PM29_PUCGR|nr:hypothetical protein PGTUg99_031061 [Puccinia graminis f. sp. tritici]